MNPKITVCIRTYNEASYIKSCLEKVLSQKTVLKPDILIIDSGSKDGTVSIARKFPVRIHEISKESFHYAETLNLGVQLSDCDLFVPLSAHAIPIDSNWLQPMVDAVWSDSKCAAAFSRQVVQKTIDPFEKNLSVNFFPGEEKTIWLSKKSTQKSFSIVFSNTSSCLRTELLKIIPFRKIPRCEDRLWATEVVRLGYNVKYTPRSCVCHTHNFLPMNYYNMGRTDGIAKELCDGPVGFFWVLLSKICPCAFLALQIDWLVKTVKVKNKTSLLFKLCAFYGNSFALRLGTLSGIREAIQTIRRFN